MSLPFSDNFGTVAQNLSAYGNGWQVIGTGGGTPTVDGAGHMGVGTVTGGTLVVNSNASIQDGTVACGLTYDVGCGAGVVLRYQDANNFYLVGVGYGNDTTLNVYLYTCVGGTFAKISPTYNGPAVAAGTEFECSIEASESSFAVSINGSPVVTLGDPNGTFPNAGLVGIRNGNDHAGSRLVGGTTPFTVQATPRRGIVFFDPAPSTTTFTATLPHIGGSIAVPAANYVGRTIRFDSGPLAGTTGTISSQSAGRPTKQTFLTYNFGLSAALPSAPVAVIGDGERDTFTII